MKTGGLFWEPGDYFENRGIILGTGGLFGEPGDYFGHAKLHLFDTASSIRLGFGFARSDRFAASARSASPQANRRRGLKTGGLFVEPGDYFEKRGIILKTGGMLNSDFPHSVSLKYTWFSKKYNKNIFET